MFVTKQALLLLLMDELTRARLKLKFEIAYVIVKEKMPFKKNEDYLWPWRVLGTELEHAYTLYYIELCTLG